MNLADMERITHNSSAISPMCGKRSLTGIPLSPRGLNAQGLGKIVPSWLNMVRSVLNGIG